MIPINIGYYYNLGTVLLPLSDIEAGSPLKEIMPILYDAESHLDGLLKSQEIPVRTCYNAGYQLLSAIRDAKAKIGVEENLIWIDAYRITSGVEKFVTVLLAELQVGNVYYVSQKGGYSTDVLIEQGEALFPIEIRIDIPNAALEDFRQGCRCLAFELPTAAGFHFLRSTEAILHTYYDVVSGGKARPTVGQGNDAPMGVFIAEVEKCNADPKVIGVLRQLKDLHRNSLVHPEDVLTMTDALILLGIVLSVVMAMVQEMQGIKLARLTPNVTAVPSAPPETSGEEGTGAVDAS